MIVNSLLTCLAASTHLLYSLFCAQWPGRPDDVSLLLITIQWLTFHTWNKIRIIFRLALHDLASLYFAKHFLKKKKNLLFSDWAGLPSVHQMCLALSYLRAFVYVLPFLLTLTSQLKVHLLREAFPDPPPMLISTTALCVLPQSMNISPLSASLTRLSSLGACSGRNYRRNLWQTLELVKR